MTTRTTAAVVAALTLSAPAVLADDSSPLARLAARLAGVQPDRASQVEAAAREALQGSQRLDATALPLVMALAVRESGLRPSVEACAVTGDGGRAVGLWQEHARGEKRAALCSGGMRAQAAEAVRHLELCGGDERHMVACYAGRAADHPIVADRLALAERLRAAR